MMFRLIIFKAIGDFLLWTMQCNKSKNEFYEAARCSATGILGGRIWRNMKYAFLAFDPVAEREKSSHINLDAQLMKVSYS